ncbi:MAG: TIGR03084 family metal-binding protein [Acidimicrobiales bacterium]|jgi:uncharacterized protein (TIGR03084 family)|nr:TIGR03084 family metal-binding protein [Acidimicrobiales bacterium]MDP6298206.1 TIGR03084 family metal-binding protein [Acidimicrobiales bacterium]HJM28927.1 TIGR03084 family metal-binding protein [Acidimicrobiales bacterium]HJM97270.1 TIGR03084 family metal-binding protein [Acidimicrobiales bacterium]
MNVDNVRSDLLEEQEALDKLLSVLGPEDWRQSTPSPRWSVADQVAHLTYFDNTAVIAITNPDTFRNLVKELMSMITDAQQAEDFTLADYRKMNHLDLLQAWREGRGKLAEAAYSLGDEDRVIWYGPPMGSKSFLTARLMEVWAHGQDIVDALRIERESTDRLRHIAQLGFITRSWSYMNRGLEPSQVPVKVILESPSGEIWNFGADDAGESVTGTAKDFCLVTTQRRNLIDTELVANGDSAMEWLTIAQAFAGPATNGPVSL